MTTHSEGRNAFEQRFLDAADGDVKRAGRLRQQWFANLLGQPAPADAAGDGGFDWFGWQALGMRNGTASHYPMGVDAAGNPQPPGDAGLGFRYICWCGDLECPLDIALGRAWEAGRRSIDG